MKNLLITGGAGFIGSNFIHYILDHDPHIKVVNFDVLTYAACLKNLEDLPDPSRYTFIEGDICDADKVDADPPGRSGLKTRGDRWRKSVSITYPPTKSTDRSSRMILPSTKPRVTHRIRPMPPPRPPAITWCGPIPRPTIYPSP